MSYKILTVDDSKMVRSIVAKTFRAYGCEVFEAANGVDGLAMAVTLIPDLIVLDITMADMNGLVALEKMRETEALQSTPVIMLTAESGDNYIARADQLNVAGYISKPFRREHLLDLAIQILDLKPLVTS